MSKRTLNFGGTGGGPFNSQFPFSIGLRSGSYVDALILNGNTYGGNGGHEGDTIYFDSDEYINSIKIRSGSYIDYIKFSTNKGKSIEGGGSGGGEFEINDIMVTNISGRSGGYLDAINITIIEGYEPSKIVDKGRFILNYKSPSTDIEIYSESNTKTMDSYEMVTTHMLSQDYSVSVEADYYVKVSASTEIQIQDSETSTIQKSLEKELKNSEKETHHIDANHVGVILQECNIYQCGEEFWINPAGLQTFAMIDMKDDVSIDALRGMYDISDIFEQIPQLKKGKITKNGYTYYPENNS